MTRYKWVILGVIGTMFAASLWMSLFSFVESIPTALQSGGLPVIIIDPGHGGLDGGAVGVDNIVEKNINLSLALILRDIFEVNGFQVIMTRTEDVSIHDEEVKGVKKQKTSDLRNRLKIVNAHPNAILISVHQNKFGESSSKGTHVFYSPNNPNSQRLAKILQDGYVANLQPDNKRVEKVAGKNLYLMTQATCTGVLVEYGFLSNSGEAHRLLDQEYQAQLAFTTFCGVMEFLELDQPLTLVTETLI